VLAADRRQRENQRLHTHAAMLNRPAVDQRGTDSGRIQRRCPLRIQSADSIVAAGLHRLLAEGQAQPVTLIAATAGWGKTSLAGSWLAAGAGDRAAAWVSLDAGDDADRGRSARTGSPPRTGVLGASAGAATPGSTGNPNGGLRRCSAPGRRTARLGAGDAMPANWG
jgi:hypothetical protein